MSEFRTRCVPRLGVMPGRKHYLDAHLGFGNLLYVWTSSIGDGPSERETDIDLVMCSCRESSRATPSTLVVNRVPIRQPLDEM